VGVLLVGTTTMIDFNFISLLVRMQEVWLSWKEQLKKYQLLANQEQAKLLVVDLYHLSTSYDAHTNTTPPPASTIHSAFLFLATRKCWHCCCCWGRGGGGVKWS
jgi:hypothetical protein